MPLIELNSDILFKVAYYISAEDIVNLSLTSKSLNDTLKSNSIYHLLYTKKFGSKPTPLNLDNYNWKDLFKLRSSTKARLYTWGSSQFGRLGYLLRDIPNENITLGSMRNVHTPTQLKNFNEMLITDINANGFCFQILTNDGALYYTGKGWKRGEGQYLTPGPYNCSDYSPPINPSAYSMPFVQSLLSRRHITSNIPPMPGMNQRYDRIPRSSAPPDLNRETNPNLTRPHTLDLPDSSLHKESNLESNFVTKLELPKSSNKNRKIVYISSGREHILAMDNSNSLYTWDTGNTTKVGVHLQFSNISNSVKVTKISAGWNLSSCHFEKIGIAVWFTRDSVSKENFENGSLTSKAKYIIIPGTVDIVDFLACIDFVLYIDSKGKLNRFELNANNYASGNIDASFTEELYYEDSFNNWIEENNRRRGTCASFTKLCGCYNKFAVLTNDGLVLLGAKESETPTVIPQLQDKGIIDVVMGDYHYLALTKGGDVLSWGVESGNCGCLGLGDKNYFTANNSNISNDLGHNRGMSVSIPSLVKNPTKDGKWLSVAAAGWHTCGIYILSDDI